MVPCFFTFFALVQILVCPLRPKKKFLPDFFVEIDFFFLVLFCFFIFPNLCVALKLQCQVFAKHALKKFLEFLCFGTFRIKLSQIMGSLHRQVAVLVPDEKPNCFDFGRKKKFQSKTRQLSSGTSRDT